MKAFITDNTLIVRGLFRTRFFAASSDITVVKVMTSRDYYPPAVLRWLFREKVRLRFVMLGTDDNEITLDVRRDTGTSDAIGWLKDAGWNIDAGIQEAVKTPLIRVAVQKMRSY
jgi:hypothetical protein